MAVVGYGKMGREVETVLLERGHLPVIASRGTAYPPGCVVGIDFTAPSSVTANVAAALVAGSRYVVGTTGWSGHLDEIRMLVETSGGGLVHAANFSIGVNLFYRIVRQAAKALAPFTDYDPYILERHHREKKDAPSGTARVLTSILEEAGGARHRAATRLEGALPPDAFHVASVRAGGTVGEHTVGFDSGADEILLEHRARSRRGFALGAVLAGEWIADRTGFYPFEAVLEELARP
ncbi:MAG TPA: 4-hydroxy-tetrahydrodipicolinate reductase [Vicinamibacteria bacterium]|nr:4-hydroxy-tetrahydrodipicolinate reductase [Vicinamibacteria bacterium]